MYYRVEVVVGIDAKELTIDNSEKYKKVVSSSRRCKKTSVVSSSRRRKKTPVKSSSVKRYYYPRREFKVQGFDEEIFDYESDAWDFMKRKSGLEYVSHEDSPSTVIGKIILSGSGVNNWAYESMDLEEIAKAKEKVEKCIFKTFGVEVHARVHFVGYYA